MPIPAIVKLYVYTQVSQNRSGVTTVCRESFLFLVPCTCLNTCALFPFQGSAASAPRGKAECSEVRMEAGQVRSEWSSPGDFAV